MVSYDILKNTITKLKRIATLTLVSVLFVSCWKDKSPEDLIRLKDKFKSTVSAFEKKKETANKNVTKGLKA
jgi:hypothetical protein